MNVKPYSLSATMEIMVSSGGINFFNSNNDWNFISAFMD